MDIKNLNKNDNEKVLLKKWYYITVIICVISTTILGIFRDSQTHRIIITSEGEKKCPNELNVDSIKNEKKNKNLHIKNNINSDIINDLYNNNNFKNTSNKNINIDTLLKNNYKKNNFKNDNVYKYPGKDSITKERKQELQNKLRRIE